MYPAPYPQHHGYASRPLFRDSRSLVRTAMVLWVLAALAALIVGIVQAGQDADELARYKAGEIPASDLRESFNLGWIVGGTTALTALLSIGGLVMVILATFRLAKNHQSFGRPGTRFGPGWAIAGWLVPFANVVIPYLLVRDLWRGSDPDLGLDSYEWTVRRSHRAIWLAFALTLAAIVVGIVVAIRVASSSFNSFGTLSDREQFDVALAQATADARPLQYLVGVLTLLSTCLMAWVLMQVAQRQQVLAERLRLVGADGRPQYVPPAFAPTYQPLVATFPPGWFADPWKRFQLRWWDGTQWSSHVSTDGLTAYDSPDGLPPAPPG